MDVLYNSLTHFRDLNAGIDLSNIMEQDITGCYM